MTKIEHYWGGDLAIRKSAFFILSFEVRVITINVFVVGSI